MEMDPILSFHLIVDHAKAQIINGIYIYIYNNFKDVEQRTLVKAV